MEGKLKDKDQEKDSVIRDLSDMTTKYEKLKRRYIDEKTKSKKEMNKKRAEIIIVNTKLKFEKEKNKTKYTYPCLKTVPEQVQKNDKDAEDQDHLDQVESILEEEMEMEEDLLKAVPEPGTTDKGVVLANQVSQNDNLFRCDVCNKGFKKKRGLVIHLKTHESKSRTLKCPCIGKDNKPCEKAFYVKHALNSHMNTHTS